MHSLIAGTTAGAVEASVCPSFLFALTARSPADRVHSWACRFITYPTEFVKTRSQFSGKVRTFAPVFESYRSYVQFPTLILAPPLETKPHSYHPRNRADQGVDGSLLRMHGISHRCVPSSALPRTSGYQDEYGAGNAVKAGVRFVSYDHLKHALADAEVCPSLANERDRD